MDGSKQRKIATLACLAGAALFVPGGSASAQDGLGVPTNAAPANAAALNAAPGADALPASNSTPPANAAPETGLGVGADTPGVAPGAANAPAAPAGTPAAAGAPAGGLQPATATAGGALAGGDDDTSHGAGAGSGSAPAAPHAYEMRFRFQHQGTPSPHSFLLKWDSPDTTLKTIDVLVADTPEVLQTLTLPADKTHLLWQDLQSKDHGVKDKFIDYKDFNFDNYGDLSLTMTWPYKVGEKHYLIWLFNAQKNRYELSAALSALPGPVPDEKTKRIDSLTLGAYGGGEYVDRSFSINGQGVLQLERKVTQTVSDPRHLNFVREVRLREDGDLHRICRMRIPAEGKPKLLSGNKKLCTPFLEKGAPKYMQSMLDPDAKAKAKIKTKAEN